MDFGKVITNNEELRIVMVGKTGTGKSASGNTILGRRCFESKFSAKSLTVNCHRERGEVGGQSVAIIDSPGLFDTRFSMERTSEDLSKCISYSSPGPHVFLVVIRLGRYTSEENQTVQRIQQIFGHKAAEYSMILFTGGDQLDESSIEDFLVESVELQDLVSSCKGRYHVFNNKLKDEEENRQQAAELLQKIQTMVDTNGGSHYTSEMFQEAERKLIQEKERILKEQEEQIQREKEEMKQKMREKYDKEKEEFMKKFEAEQERERERREEEYKKQKEDWNEEKQKEREEREKERQRESKELKKTMDDMIESLRKKHEQEMEQAINKMREHYERQARRQAEENGILHKIGSICSIL